VVLPPPSNDILVSGIEYAGENGTYPVQFAFIAALREDGTFDDGWFDHGKQTFLIPLTSVSYTGATLALQAGKLLLAGGWTPQASEAAQFWVLRLYRDAVFGDDFEGGRLRLWSNHADP
jgi:hypothetical protein